MGITSRALDHLGALGTTSGRVVLGAAIIDDVLAMLLVAVAVGMSEGGVDAGEILVTLGLAAAFIGVVLLAGTGILSRHRSILTRPRFAETPFLPGMIVMLGLAALAAVIGLAAIIGAFLAGMVVGESAERDALEAETAPVAAFFTPFFFGFVGAQVDLAVFGQPQTDRASCWGSPRSRSWPSSAEPSWARCPSVGPVPPWWAGPWSPAARWRSSWPGWRCRPGHLAPTCTWSWSGW